ncbi:MAG: electron transfer flavoprotein subunit alpha/FixB family protein [Telluria sp.]
MSGILVIAEHSRGVLADISSEMLGAACQLKEKIGGPLRVLVVGQDLDAIAALLDLPGVDDILLADTGNAHFDAAATEEAAFQAALRQAPALIMIGHCASGMSYASALAVRIGSGFAADVFAIDVVQGAMCATRAGYGSKVNIELRFPDKPVVILTLRGATFKAPQGKGAASVQPFAVAPPATGGRYQHVEYIEAPSSGVDITKAEFIMSIGRGVQDEKNVPRFAAIAEKLGATLGCSRPIADSGWLHKAHQVGLTGKVAGSCKLYVALGISGAVQHLHGMKHVDTIIAVNTDPNAPIFNVASYGCTVDVFEFADAIESLL